MNWQIGTLSDPTVIWALHKIFWSLQMKAHWSLTIKHPSNKRSRAMQLVQQTGVKVLSWPIKPSAFTNTKTKSTKKNMYVRISVTRMLKLARSVLIKIKYWFYFQMDVSWPEKLRTKTIKIQLSLHFSPLTCIIIRVQLLVWMSASENLLLPPPVKTKVLKSGIMSKELYKLLKVRLKQHLVYLSIPLGCISLSLIQTN